MKLSDAYLSIARAAYEVANELDPEDRDEISLLAVEMDVKFVDLRDEGR